MGKMEIPYVEKDGVLYPLLTVPADIELSAVGKYGLLWLSYMKENHKGRFRTLTRLGCVNRTAHKVNEEAYEMLDVIISQHMGKHPPVNPGSTMEMWKLREQAKVLNAGLPFMYLKKNITYISSMRIICGSPHITPSGSPVIKSITGLSP